MEPASTSAAPPSSPPPTPPSTPLSPLPPKVIAYQTQVRSLVDLSLHAVCRNIHDDIVYLTDDCKQKLLELCSSHRILANPACVSAVSLPRFGLNLSNIKFFCSDDVTDDILRALTEYNKNLRSICLVECNQGIRALTADQSYLETLELRSMRKLTAEAFSLVRSDSLSHVDISGCTKIRSLRPLLSWNRGIARLSVNSCSGLDDAAFCDVAFYLGESLQDLEMDFFHRLAEPSATLAYLAAHCPRLSSLSLIRFFHQDTTDEEASEFAQDCNIEDFNLQNVDLYENYFVHLPRLPSTIQSISISLSGEENVDSLIASLSAPYLNAISIRLYAKEDSAAGLNNANHLLCTLIQHVGPKIVSLQIALYHIYDDALKGIVENTHSLRHLVIRAIHINNRMLQRYFAVGSAGCRLRTLKISDTNVSYRALFAIARGAKALRELEMQNMRAMDDRVLMLMADNCRNLSSIDVNYCTHVTDRGLQALARRCPLREMFIRGTAATDATLYALASFCPQLEIICFQDCTRRPGFSLPAIEHMQRSCIQRVLC